MCFLLVCCKDKQNAFIKAAKTKVSSLISTMKIITVTMHWALLYIITLEKSKGQKEIFGDFWLSMSLWLPNNDHVPIECAPPQFWGRSGADVYSTPSLKPQNRHWELFYSNTNPTAAWAPTLCLCVPQPLKVGICGVSWKERRKTSVCQWSCTIPSR